MKAGLGREISWAKRQSHSFSRAGMVLQRPELRREPGICAPTPPSYWMRTAPVEEGVTLRKVVLFCWGCSKGRLARQGSAGPTPRPGKRSPEEGYGQCVTVYPRDPLHDRVTLEDMCSSTLVVRPFHEDFWKLRDSRALPIAFGYWVIWLFTQSFIGTMESITSHMSWRHPFHQFFFLISLNKTFDV